MTQHPDPTEELNTPPRVHRNQGRVCRGAQQDLLRSLAIGALALSMLLGAPLFVGTIAAQTRAPALGIGGFMNRSNSATESFDVAAYFRAHPVVVSGRPLPVRLVDRTLETEFALSGFVLPGEVHVNAWYRGRREDTWTLPCRLGSGRNAALITWQRMPDVCLGALRARVATFVTQHQSAGRS